VQLVAYYSGEDSLIELKNHAFYVSAIIQNNKPIAEFSVTKQSGEIDELFYFNDMSSYFPNNWKWTFTPNNVWLVSSDYTSQNPIVSFYANGFYQISLRVSNPFGADSITKTDFIRIGKTTSTNSNLIPNSLQIYPNPAQDILQLRTEPNSNLEVEIYAFNGALVQTEKVITDANGLTQLNTEKLSDGFYHLRIKSNLGELGKTFGISR
jgi:PKD repeat protein